MAILFMDGFDGFDTLNDLRRDKRIAIPSSSSVAVNFTTDANGGKAIGLSINSMYFYLDQDSTDTVFLQMAFYPSFTFESNDEWGFAFLDSASDEIIYFYINENMNIVFERGTTAIATGAETVNPIAWNYLEIKINFNNSTGTVYSKLNGVEDVNSTGLDTQNGSSNTASIVMFKSSSVFSRVYVDNLIIGDSSGTQNNDLLGEVFIETITPDGAGNYTQFTPSTGSNFENVDELPVTNSNYNSSSTAGHKDSFSVSNISSSTVLAVQVAAVSDRGTGANRFIRTLLRESATDFFGDSSYVPEGIIHNHTLYNENPSGGAWTDTDVNALEIGYEIQS